MNALFKQIKSELNSFRFKPLLKEWWWVCCALMLSCAFHLHAKNQKQIAFSSLSSTLYAINAKKSIEIDLNRELKLRISSQSDPEWIKLMLMKGLGVVPNGHIKVHFDEDLGM
ncbi:MAG: hypothetical protein P0S95_01685 [Rhabdochlamydiaceae bacterium]|nr:hypothetical protein [Candidatus Amphrikana amoebophyrae]